MAIEYKQRLFTVTDYQRMAETGILDPDERVELIEGVIVEMPPIGPPHASVTDRLSHLLHIRLADRVIVRTQGPIVLGLRSQPEPDLALLKPRQDFYRSAHPGPDDVLLVVEVADSSLVRDRGTKLALYARYGVPEYWVLDVNGDVIEVYRAPEGETYTERSVHRRGEPISPLAFGDLSVDPDEILP